MMQERNNKTVIVIPCFNEAARIDQGAVEAFCAGAGDISLLFVDDGSRDRTLEVLRALPSVRSGRNGVMALERNSGKAEAVRRGVLAALDSNASVVGFWDADLATPLSAIPDLLRVLQANPHLDWVIGARVRLLGRLIQRRALRHYLGRIFATFASLILALPVYDTQCGAKLFRGTPELRQLLSRPFVARWVFDVELIARLVKARRFPASVPVSDAIYEFPLEAWADIAGSKLKARDYARAVRDLFGIWRYLHAEEGVENAGR